MTTVDKTNISPSVPWKAVSFSCGGWLQFYLFGVARAMQVRGLDKNIKVAGCSAGSLAAAGLVLGVSIHAYIEYFLMNIFKMYVLWVF